MTIEELRLKAAEITADLYRDKQHPGTGSFLRDCISVARWIRDGTVPGGEQFPSEKQGDPENPGSVGDPRPVPAERRPSQGRRNRP